MLLEKYGNGGFTDAALGDADEEIVELVLGAPDANPVQAKERQRAGQRRSFIAIDEWMIAANVEEIRRTHLEERLMKKFSAERRHHRSQCRLEQTDIADSGGATVLLNAVFVNGEDLVEGKELRIHYSASRLKTPPYSASSSSRMRFSLRVREGSGFGEITMI